MTTTLGFDVYGTLIDTAGITKALAAIQATLTVEDLPALHEALL
jgi:hypothetical protein